MEYFGRAKYAKEKYLNAQDSEEQELNELYAYLKGEELPENTSETEAGTIVKLPSKWQTTTPRYIKTENGVEAISTTKVASVYAVATGNGETVPVPVGFWYVGGTLTTGVVISDKEADSYLKNKRDMSGHSDAINLIGNQFVFVPCTVDNYKKCDVWNGSKQTSSNLANSNWDTYTNSAEKVQIETYIFL